jgi:hypothetical protein
MQSPKRRQKFQPIHSSIASVVSVLYGSLLMRTSGAIAIAALVSSSTLSLPGYAAILEDWKIDPSTGIVEVLLPAGVRPRLSVATEPARLVVDLPDTEIGINITERFESGVISQVSFTQSEPEVTRITIDFVPGVVLDEREVDFRPVGIENLWVLRPTIIDRPAPAPAFPIAQTPEAPQTVDQVDQTTSDSAADLETSQPETTEAEVTPPTPTPQTPGFPSPQRVDQTVIPNPQPAPTPNLETTPPPPPETVAIEPQPQPESQDGTIPFGQPLPRTSQPRSTTSSRTIDQRPPNVLLPAGTQLTLRYPNPNEVRLKNKPERQDVLLLQGGITDKEGNYIIPPDTPIVGYFETSSRGSRFQVEAINLEGRSIPLKAESGWISGTLDAEPKNILRDTGIGGLGLFLLTGFTGVGLLVGAIGGAAVGFATSPQPTTLQPDQVIEVRLVEDLRQSQFLTTPPN